MSSQLQLTVAQSRRVDQLAVEKYKVPSLVLMENAGRGCVDVFLRDYAQHGPVVIICGKGNNAGDGFVIARHLFNEGESVELLMLCGPDDLTGDALTNFEIAKRIGIPHQVVDPANDETLIREKFDKAAWIFDAMLGSGLSGEVREPFATMIELANASGSSRLAVDLPSGLEADEGEVLGCCFRAKATVTFAASKVGLTRKAGPEYAGEVKVVRIGIPDLVVDEAAR